MSPTLNSAFKVGLVQMRSGVDPQANLATALAAIEEAARAGAAYVLTPEMTNIMEIERDRLFATIADEELDPTLAAMRQAARAYAVTASWDAVFEGVYAAYESLFPAAQQTAAAD